MDKKQIEQLRQKFFDECTELPQRNSKGNFTRKVNLAPHDLFEWIKKNCIEEKVYTGVIDISKNKEVQKEFLQKFYKSTENG